VLSFLLIRVLLARVALVSLCANTHTHTHKQSIFSLSVPVVMKNVRQYIVFKYQVHDFLVTVIL
jgi:hypothetical protein